MRNLIENPMYMTYEDMKKQFDGRWILITKCEYAEFGKLVGGVPVAVADKVFEGVDDGFYDRFRSPEYAPRTDMSFNYESGVFGGFFGELNFVGGRP